MSNAQAIATIAKFAEDLRRLPRVVGHRVAEAAAPEITALARRTFDQSATPYGVPWAPANDGAKVTLHRTGALARTVVYVAIGAKLRVKLGVPYAKWQIGKRPIYPRQDSPLPPDYAATLARIAVEVVRAELGAAGMRGAA